MNPTPRSRRAVVSLPGAARRLPSAALIIAAVVLAFAPYARPAAAEPWDPRLAEVTTVSLAITGDPSFRANVAGSLRAWGRFDLVGPGDAEAVVEGEGVWVAEGFLGRLAIVDRATGDVLWTATRLRRSRIPSDSMAFEQLVAQLRAYLEGS